MFGLFAVVFFLFAFVAGGADAHTSGWFTPQQSVYAGLACLALHLCGIGTNRRP
jgi:hypothetical protein